MVERGFAYYDPLTNKICIPEEQLINIFNFNETAYLWTGALRTVVGNLR